jgi:DNA-binding NarL/FixJ family response regulator
VPKDTVGAMRRIMLVDDHDIILRGLRAQFGARPDLEIVAEVADGWAAIEAARSASPDVAIVDHPLPQFSGPDLCVKLRELLPSIHIIIYSSFDDEQLILDMLQAGARAYVFKSDPFEDLMTALDADSDTPPLLSRSLPPTLLERSKPTGGGPTNRT